MKDYSTVLIYFSPILPWLKLELVRIQADICDAHWKGVCESREEKGSYQGP